MSCRPYYVVTKTYTARCQEGMAGAPVTMTRQVCSRISEEDAARKALRWAKSEANAALVCYFESTASATGTCGEAASATAQSFISQADAQNQALELAVAAAEAICNPEPEVFFNTEQTATCAEGSTGDAVVIAAGLYSAETQEAADALALAAANAAIVCTPECDCSGITEPNVSLINDGFGNWTAEVTLPEIEAIGMWIIEGYASVASLAMVGVPITFLWFPVPLHIVFAFDDSECTCGFTFEPSLP